MVYNKHFVRTCKRLLHIALLVATPHKCRTVSRQFFQSNMSILFIHLKEFANDKRESLDSVEFPPLQVVVIPL